jgi:ABC-type Zn uptake system ZnuABC Zn-binding protein ZnuA
MALSRAWRTRYYDNRNIEDSRFFDISMGGRLRRLAAWLVALSIIPSFASAGAAPAAAQDARPNVVATFSVVGDLVQRVGGDRINLTVLVGADGDTERYEPTPGDAQALASAAIVFENGLGSEPWLDRLYAGSRSSAQRKRISDGVDLIRAQEHGTELDPHIWHDPVSMIQATYNVRDTLSAVDQANADAYASNADAYVAQLQSLHGWITDRVATLPAERRKLVTSHDTFGYFARRYGFQIVGAGLESFFTDAQPSAGDIARLVRDIRAAGVPVVFVENVTDPRLMQRVASEAWVTVGPSLYTDALGAAGSPGGTYLDMMTYNVNSIVGALGQ